MYWPLWSIIFFGCESTVSMQFRRYHPGVYLTKIFLLSEVIGFVSAFRRSGDHVFVERRSIDAYGLRCAVLSEKYSGKAVRWNCGNQSSCWTDRSVWRIFFRVLALHGRRDRALGRVVGAVHAFRRILRGISVSRLQLFTLDSGIGFWPAAIFLSLLFGAVHLQNSGENRTGVAAVLWSVYCGASPYGGLVQPVVRRRECTRPSTSVKLFSIPFRTAACSSPAHLSNATMQGPAWLTGGTVGPEASVFDFLLLLYFFLRDTSLYPARPSQPNPDQLAYYHQFRRKHQLHALSLGLRQWFLQRFQRGAVRVSDGDRFAFSRRSAIANSICFRMAATSSISSRNGHCENQRALPTVAPYHTRRLPRSSGYRYKKVCVPPKPASIPSSTSCRR